MSGAVTATAVAVAAMSAAEVFTAVAVVGAVVGGVGMITGSKELKIAGMVLGAVGGIGGLAASAGLFAGEAAVELGTVAATDAASWAGDVAAVAGPEGGYTMAGLAAANIPGGAIPGATADIINEVSGAVSAADLPGEIVGGSGIAAPDVSPAAATDTGAVGSAVTQPVVEPTGTVDVAPTDLKGNVAYNADGTVNYNGAPTSQGDITTTGPDGQTITTTTNDAPKGLLNSPSVTPPAAAPAAEPVTATSVLDPTKMVSTSAIDRTLDPALGSAGGKDSGIWASITDLLDKKATGPLISGAIQAGGAFIAGATSSLTPAQVAALQAQATQNQAAANLANQQAQMLARQNANMMGGIPVATRSPPRVTGLINTPAPVTPGAVTGVPA